MGGGILVPNRCHIYLVPTKCQDGAIREIVIWSQTSAREVPYGRRYFGAQQVPYIFGADKVSRWCHSRNYNLVPNKCQGGAVWKEVFWCLASAREVPCIFGADKVSRWCHSRNAREV